MRPGRAPSSARRVARRFRPRLSRRVESKDERARRMKSRANRRLRAEVANPGFYGLDGYGEPVLEKSSVDFVKWTLRIPFKLKTVRGARFSAGAAKKNIRPSRRFDEVRPATPARHFRAASDARERTRASPSKRRSDRARPRSGRDPRTRPGALRPPAGSPKSARRAARGWTALTDVTAPRGGSR